jgi:hypothetical protein
MDHPAEIDKVERNLAKLLKKGFTLDELEDIEVQATEVGRLVRGTGTDIWPSAYQAWMDYRETLPDGVKAEAEDAFYRGYIL